MRKRSAHWCSTENPYGRMSYRSVKSPERQCRKHSARWFVRAARAYKTVSYAAATVLAGLLPMKLIAQKYAKTFRTVRSFRGRSIKITATVRVWIRFQCRRQTLKEWSRILTAPSISGQRFVGAILSMLDSWVHRTWSGLSFRATQILTRHKCFGLYLCRSKRQCVGCHHCGSPNDTAQYAGRISGMDGRKGGGRWSDRTGPLSASGNRNYRGKREYAFSSFCERVMLQKKEVERQKRGQIPDRQYSNRREGNKCNCGVGGRIRSPSILIQAPTPTPSPVPARVLRPRPVRIPR